MTDKIKSPAVSFYDGCIIDKDIISMCGKLDFLDYDDYSHSRSYIMSSNNAWGGDDLPFMTISACWIGLPSSIICRQI